MLLCQITNLTIAKHLSKKKKGLQHYKHIDEPIPSLKYWFRSWSKYSFIIDRSIYAFDK